ncbi:MAG: hypothetical protein PHY14_04170 [Candidatus Gracilibacteria bacterium]|nr:hypothetical protein [Candidatus Gracilibacteria bacterium]
MTILIIIGSLIGVLYPLMKGYFRVAHDTDRFVGAKTINAVIKAYYTDHESYPIFPPELLDESGFTHGCSNYSTGFTWDQTITPIMIQYTGKSPTDRIGEWPLCYMYKNGAYPNCLGSVGYALIFGTEGVRSDLKKYSVQGDDPSVHRYCLTDE